MPRTVQAYSTTSTAPALQRVWQSMRIMRRFTIGDLMTTSEAGKTAVEKYVAALRKAGYLRLVHNRVNGRAGSRDVFALARDTGPLAPIRRKDNTGVFDPNTDLVWNLQGEIVRHAAPPPPPRLPQAAREALRQLHGHGTCKATPQTLQALLAGGLVSLAVTDAGRAVLKLCPEAPNQRGGAGLAAADLAAQETDHAAA